MRQPHPARVTNVIVALTSIAFLLATLTGGLEWAAAAGGFVPARVSGLLVFRGAAPAWLTPLTATLVHASFLHLLFNMVMLGFCGKLVEEAIGARGMMILYLIGAYAAAFAQYLANPHEIVPMVGASGAASAVLGVYALLYGRHREAVAHPGLNRLINIAWLAAAWIGIQLLFGYAGASEGMSIAIAAHIGGFLAGLLLARPLLLWRYRES
jgi:membrane associated rhomboid family serine protease